jgi:hypothetical protein
VKDKLWSTSLTLPSEHRLGYRLKAFVLVKKLNSYLGDHACYTHNVAIHIYRGNSTILYAMADEHLTEKQDWGIRSALVKCPTKYCITFWYKS